MINWLDANSADRENPPQCTNRVGVVTWSQLETYGNWKSLVPKTGEVPGVLQTLNPYRPICQGSGHAPGVGGYRPASQAPRRTTVKSTRGT